MSNQLREAIEAVLWQHGNLRECGDYKFSNVEDLPERLDALRDAFATEALLA